MARLILTYWALAMIYRDRPQYVVALLRAFDAGGPRPTLEAIARTEYAPALFRYAVNAYGRPPQSVIDAATGQQRAEPGGEESSESVASDVAGVAGTLIGGPALGGVASAVLGELGIGRETGEGQNRGQCHLELGRLTSQQQQALGAQSIPDASVGHLRVGRCESDGRQACVALEPAAIRLGSDYVVARYPGRLAAELADRFTQNGTLTDTGQRTLATAYLKTLNAVQLVPRGGREFLDKFGYYPPDDDCNRVPPHKADFAAGTPKFFYEGGADTPDIPWVTRQRLLLSAAIEFMEQIQRELDAARPLLPSVRATIAQYGYNPAGDFSLSASRQNPPRIELIRRGASDFLAPAA